MRRPDTLFVLFPLLQLMKREDVLDSDCEENILIKGSRVCFKASGTVYGVTDEGKALIVLDSDTHPGVILAPNDSKREWC